MKLIFIALAVLSLSACSIVGPGQRGVRVSLGSVSDEPKSPGAYIWFPVLFGMAKINVQIQNSEFESEAASRDMQDVHAKVAVNWSLSPDAVVKTFKEIGDEDDVERRILAPAVAEIMKAATAKRTAEEVLTKRLELKDDIDTTLKERLAQYGISLHDLSIVNLRFSEGFSQAVEHKQIAEQQAKQAAYVAEKATQDAKADIERAKGQAEAQRLLKSTITSEILQQEAIKKWDGKFPQVMGAQTLPFINLGGAQ